MPDDMRLLFVDEDTVIDVTSESHDTHLQKFDNREDELLAWINSTLMKTIHDDKVERNRERISEIQKYVDHVRDQLEETLLPDYHQ